MQDRSGLRSVVVDRRRPTHTDPHPGGWRWTVMADPEGNEFCVFPLPEEA